MSVNDILMVQDEPVPLELLPNDPCEGLCGATRGEVFRTAGQDEDCWTADRWTADQCGVCGWCVPWSDVVSGASVRSVVDGSDVRLCAACTAERAR